MNEAFENFHKAAVNFKNELLNAARPYVEPILDKMAELLKRFDK